MTFRNELTDEELGWIIRQWGEAMARRYPLEPPRPHRFSWRFRLRMERLCRRAEQEEARPIPAAGGEGAAGCPRPRQGHRLSPRMLAAAVLAAVLCSTAAMASMRYFRLVREEHPKYSTIRYEQLEEGYRPGEFVAYHLTYLPEGFEQVQDRTTEIDHVETYENPEQLIVRLRQKQIDNARLDVDTEHITPEVILLNGRQSAWYLGNDSLKTIYWDDGIYFFSVSGHLSKEELVKVAESVGKK